MGSAARGLKTAIFFLSSMAVLASAAWAKNADTKYSRWNDVGAQAAFKAAGMIRKQSPSFQATRLSAANQLWVRWTA